MTNLSSHKVTWQLDIVKFFEEVLGFNELTGTVLSNQQRQALEKFRDVVIAHYKDFYKLKLNEYEASLVRIVGIAVVGGRGVGKSTLAAGCCLWAISCFPLGFARAAVIGIKEQQIKASVWAQFYVIQRQARELAHKIGVPCLLDKLVRIQAEYVFALDGSGKPAKDTFIQLKTLSQDKSESVSGFHSKLTITVLDESTGIRDDAYTAMRGSMSGAMNFMVALSNPTRDSGWFRDIFRKESDLWIREEWSAEDSSVVTPSFLASMKEEFGEGTLLYSINVLGKFPTVDNRAFVSWSDFMACVDQEPAEPMPSDPCIGGMDPAFGGGDDFSMYAQKGLITVDIETFQTNDESEMMEKVCAFIDRNHIRLTVIWGTNIGKVIASRLRNLGYHVHVIFENGVSRKPQNYANMSSELWDKAANMFHNHLINLSILKKPQYAKYLHRYIQSCTAVRRDDEVGKTSQMKSESNTVTKTREGMSPDIPDSMRASIYPAYLNMFNKAEREKEEGFRKLFSDDASFDNSYMRTF